MTEPVPAPPPKRPLVVPAALGGLIVGAALVGIPWLLFGTSGGAANSSPLTVPDTLGGLERSQVAVGKVTDNTGVAKSEADRDDKDNRENAARVSAAYGGAAAVVQTYHDDRLERGYQLTAVRANTPGLIAPYEDTELLGLAEPSQEVKEFGAVQCLVHHLATAAGETPSADKTTVSSCQRSASGLTVQLKVINQTEDNRDPAKLATTVDEAWAALS